MLRGLAARHERLQSEEQREHIPACVVHVAGSGLTDERVAVDGARVPT